LLVSFQYGTRTAARKARARLGPQVTAGVMRVSWCAVIRRFVEYALITGIICLIPAMLWAEFIIPRFHDPIPFYVYDEMTLFKILVAPPAWLADQLGMQSTAYGMMFGIGTHSPGGIAYTPPPTVAALEFWRTALPFWFLMITGLGEGAIATLTFLRRRKTA
jgi:hypothetical protein